MRYRHRALAFLSCLAIITYLDRVCISVAGPRIQDELHLGPQAWGWITGAFALAYAAFEIPSGYLGDRFGPRLMLTRLVLWWSLFTALTGSVGSFGALVAVRFLFGAGEAGAYPNTSASIFHWFPAVRRGRAFAMVWMFTQVGAGIAPLLVLPLQAKYGWRAVFHIFAFIGVAWAAAWWWWYRDNPHDKAGIPASELKEIGPAQSVTKHRLPWGQILTHGSVWALMGAAFMIVYVYNFFTQWLHTYLVRARGFSESELKYSALPFFFAALSNLVGGLARDAAVSRWGLKWGQRIIGIVGLLGSAVCMTGAELSTGRYAAGIWLALCYSAINFQLPTLWAACVDIGKRHAGALAGFMNTAANLGGVASSIVLGRLVGRTGSYSIPMATMIVVLTLGAALWLRVDASAQLEAAVEPAAL